MPYPHLRIKTATWQTFLVSYQTWLDGDRRSQSLIPFVAVASLRQHSALPSCLCLADLQYVDGFGELPGAPGAAAELTEDPPVLELRVRALAGCAELRVGPFACFWNSCLSFPRYGILAYVLPW